MKDVEFFDMFVKPTLFNIHKFDHYHPLIPSGKILCHPRPSLLITNSYNRSKRVLSRGLSWNSHRESEAFINQSNDQNKSKIKCHYQENN